MKTIKVGRPGVHPRRQFGPISHYDPLLAGEDTPAFTGVQTAEPGYVTGWHSHPYVEMLFVLSGSAEVELQGGEALHLHAGEIVAVPEDAIHRFATSGSEPLRLLGIHLSPERVVHYADGGGDNR